MSHPRAVRFLWGREEGGVLSMVKHGGSCRLGGGWKEVIRDYKEKEKKTRTTITRCGSGWVLTCVPSLLLAGK